MSTLVACRLAVRGGVRSCGRTTRIKCVVLHVAGGINDQNCKFYIDNGASHVIVTSYVFREGAIDFERLNRLKDLVGKKHLVLDLSCRKKPEDGKFYVMTDRWQTFTTTAIEYVQPAASRSIVR
jgi:phosphoribosylformimino-5-aminoimidazole carboxamide ribonucleotide (ProFAR) isomerase